MQAFFLFCTPNPRIPKSKYQKEPPLLKTANLLREKAVLVGVSRPPQVLRWQVTDYLNELELLADTAGASVLQKVMQERAKIDPVYFIGKGKVEELAQLVKDGTLDLVIFDDDLSPVQVRNLEKELQCKILDRTALILQIFALRAKTSQAKMQVELAQLQYLLPRLTGLWTHLSKQKGGIGTKGPGETQIETDRRLVGHRISVLKEKLKKIDTQRETQRKWRRSLTRIALVGYTNAGKSTLMNTLCASANVLAENRLFATLDSTARKLHLDMNKDVILTDTVGFIRKLPHNLVESFKSTLDEVRDADILLHVVDVSHPAYEEQMKVVEETLADIKADGKPTIVVFNKVDMVDKDINLRHLKEPYPNSVFASAARGINLSGLKEKIGEVVEREFVEKDARIHASNYKAISFLHEATEVLEKHYDDEFVQLKFRVSKKIEKAVDGMIHNLSDEFHYTHAAKG
jgi:GTP-binding protein HflX